ncbi:uncharacterized protein LOC121998116 [Zingiber officinale]|uniref:uncharacterized protein LOC121998116 n=1 Tax=Zingiber officinale TaxID=94328 RepID=UPI001C4D0FDE|nr:uncharacterized protein LOC121998116 [Zingiber officinale]
MSSIPVKENGGVPFPYPMLSPHNYTVWAIKTEAILDAQGVWEAVEPAEGAQVDAKKDKKARAYILQCVPEDILLQIATKKTAKEVWDSLKTRYLGSDRVKKARVQTLKSEFDALRMKETETIDEFAGKLSALSSKFSTLGDTLEDSSLVKKLLNSVPDKFFPIVAGIEQFYDLESIPFEEAIGRLKAYEERTLRLCSNTNGTEGELLLTHAEWQMRQKGSNVDTSSGGKGRGSSSPSRGKWRSRGRGTPSQDSAGGTSGNNSGTRGKRHIKCFNCEKMGHYASECYSKRRGDEAHLTCATDEEPALMMSMFHEESQRQDTILLSEERLLPEVYRGVKKGEDKDVWYLDNGASNHMTGHQAENEVHMKGDNMKVIDRNGKLLMLIKRTQNRLYKITLKIFKQACLLARQEDPTWLGHMQSREPVVRGALSMCKSARGRLGIHPSRACAQGMLSRAAVQGCPSPSLTGGRLGKPTSVAWAQAIPSRGLAMRWARSKPKFAGGRLGSKAGVADGLARVTKRTNIRDLFVVPKRSSHGPSTWCASRLWRRAKETEPWITQTDGLVRGTDKWTARGAKDGHIVVEFVNTGEQRTDVITKALSEVKPPCDNYSASVT